MPPRQVPPTLVPEDQPPASEGSGGAPASQATADLEGMFAELGIPPEMLAAILAGGGGAGGFGPFDIFAMNFADPTMAVFSRSRQVPVEPDPLFWLTGGTPPNEEVRGREGTRYRPRITVEDETEQVGDLLSGFYEWNRSDLLDRQRQLYAAGFYGDVDITDVSWGVHDEDSFVAWSRAVTRAARFFAAGRKVTVDGVLQMAAQERLGEGGIGGAGAGGGSGPRVVSLTDPLALYSTLDDTAQSILGRKATAQEQRMFVGIVHSLQRESQLAAQPVSETGQDLPADANGDGRITQAELDAALASRRAGAVDRSGEIVEMTPPSPEAQAESLLRTQNPTEAGAHDIASSFANFIQLLRGVV